MTTGMILDDMDLDMVSGGKMKFLIYTSGDSYFSIGIKGDASMDALKSKYAGMSLAQVKEKVDDPFLFKSKLTSLDAYTQKLTNGGFEFAMMN